MAPVQYRQAQPSDAAAILTLKQAAIDSIDSDQYTGAELDAWRPGDDALPAFERAIESDRFVVKLAVVDGDAAGYGVLNVPENRIDAVFVHPEHRGQGIASSLVGQLELQAQMHGISALKIVASLNAKSFYSSLNYWLFGTRTRTIDGTDVEFAILRKTLDIDWSR